MALDNNIDELQIEIGTESQSATSGLDSGLVKTWVNLIRQGTYTIEQVPALSNLKEVVAEVLAEGGESE